MTGYFSKVLAKHAKRRRRYRPIRARSLGDELVVGLVPDEEILRCKGPPLLNEKERLELVESVKWVDEVLTGVPYDLTPEFLDELFTKHRIDYVIHGDDPCILPDGTDAYAYAKKSGRFMMIKRTEGVSTTDIVGRMLMCSRNNRRFLSSGTEDLTRAFSMGHRQDDDGDQRHNLVDMDNECDNYSESKESYDGVTPRKKASDIELDVRPVTVSRFMPTSRRIVQFSSGKVAPAGSKIVYIDGAFDLFHVGTLRYSKLRGRRVTFCWLVFTQMRMYTDEVIIGAPSTITEDLLKTFNISIVVRGTMHEISDRKAASELDRYKVTSDKKILKYLKSPSNMTSAKLIQRIVKNREQFESRQARKTKTEATYYATSKQYVSEV
eukprot:jgi/Picre1/28053/NNA_001012.t2